MTKKTNLCITCNQPTPTEESFYCNVCRGRKLPKPRIWKECLNCKKLTKNPRYCCRSCSGISTNKLYVKKKKTKFYKCRTCETLLHRHGLVYCKTCFKKTLVRWDEISLAEVKGIRKYQKHSRIRNLARALYKKTNLSRKCAICGYDKHIEICHIKPISSFSESSTIAEINSLDNLIALCPNHHIELDKGLLSLTGVVT